MSTIKFAPEVISLQGLLKKVNLISYKSGKQNREIVILHIKDASTNNIVEVATSVKYLVHKVKNDFGSEVNGVEVDENTVLDIMRNLTSFECTAQRTIEGKTEYLDNGEVKKHRRTGYHLGETYKVSADMNDYYHELEKRKLEAGMINAQEVDALDLEEA